VSLGIISPWFEVLTLPVLIYSIGKVLLNNKWYGREGDFLTHLLDEMDTNMPNEILLTYAREEAELKHTISKYDKIKYGHKLEHHVITNVKFANSVDLKPTIIKPNVKGGEYFRNVDEKIEVDLPQAQ
jgi:hypothetical protein